MNEDIDMTKHELAKARLKAEIAQSFFRDPQRKQRPDPTSNLPSEWGRQGDDLTWLAVGLALPVTIVIGLLAQIA